MNQESASVHWTYDDYVHFPDDGKRHEIVEGERLVTPAPTPWHQMVLSNLYLALRTHLQDRDLGTCFVSPVDVLLARDTVVQPDLVYISSDRLSIVEENAITAAPDLVVEILSSSTRHTDSQKKRKLYATHGVREYWIVDPETERVEVHALEDGELRKSAEVAEGEVASVGAVSGFAVPLADLFRRPVGWGRPGSLPGAVWAPAHRHERTSVSMSC